MTKKPQNIKFTRNISEFGNHKHPRWRDFQ